MFCIKCGQQLGEDSKFCFVCGAETQEEDSTQDEAQSTVEDAPDSDDPELSQQDFITQSEAPPPIAVREQHQEYTYNTPQENVNANSSRQRKVVFSITVIALLAIITTAIIVIGRGRGEASAPTPQNVQGEHIQEGPDVRGEVSLYHIDRVVNGYLTSYPDITVGDAFMQYFTDYMWTHFISGNINYVSFFGTMQRDGTDVPVQVHFRFTAGDTDFNASGLFLNSYWQETFVLNELLESVFNNV